MCTVSAYTYFEILWKVICYFFILFNYYIKRHFFFDFFRSEVTITVDSKEFKIEKSMIREIKRYQKEVHGKCPGDNNWCVNGLAFRARQTR